MKVLRKVTKVVALLLILLIQFIFIPPQTAYAATSPSLGNAASFAVLAGTAITNVPTSVITGDVGISPAAGGNITGLTNAEVSGTIFTPDEAGPAGVTGGNPDLMTSAKNDLKTAYDGLSATPNDTCTSISSNLNGQSLVPGVYCAGTFTLSGTLTLDASGSADAVWIFQSADTLITSGNVAKVEFLDGTGSPCNVWWKVVSSATLATTTSFIGNILALTSITMNTGATLQGRALARNGAVTLQSNTINQSCVASHGGVYYAPMTSGGSSSSYCPPTSYTTPVIIESRRVDADSVFISWGPYSGINTFLVQYGTENGKWLYNTRVTGFSTTINNLPANAPIWVRVVATDYCSEGEFGAPKLVGGPGLPNTGFAPRENSMPYFITAGVFVILSAFLLRRIHV